MLAAALTHTTFIISLKRRALSSLRGITSRPNTLSLVRCECPAIDHSAVKARGRLKGKQIVIAAMRKLLVLCFGVLKTGKEFDPAMAVYK